MGERLQLLVEEQPSSAPAPVSKACPGGSQGSASHALCLVLLPMILGTHSHSASPAGSSDMQLSIMTYTSLQQMQ